MKLDANAAIYGLYSFLCCCVSAQLARLDLRSVQFKPWGTYFASRWA